MKMKYYLQLHGMNAILGVKLTLQFTLFRAQ